MGVPSPVESSDTPIEPFRSFHPSPGSGEWAGVTKDVPVERRDVDILSLITGIVIFSVLFLYCFIIMYPKRCRSIAKHIGYRGPLNMSMVEDTKYGIVEDSPDGVELLASGKGGKDTNMERDIQESMV